MKLHQWGPALLLSACGACAAAPPSPPSQLYPGLFAHVQMERVFPDSKTFADAVPLSDVRAIEQAYLQRKTAPGFSLRGFVMKHFALPDQAGEPPKALEPQAPAASHLPMDAHIRRLWTELARPPVPDDRARGSLLPLPAPYVVPGGRFRELYYWDSYFTMLGLVTHGRRDLAEGLVKNFAYQIGQYGHVPNGNRSYYLSRSQPPFFHLMVGLMAAPSGPHGGAPTAEAMARAYARYLEALRREHAYWMDGAERLSPGQAWRHAVAMPDGAILNRYWDDLDTPRDESYREDVETAARSGRPPAEVYRDLRAGAESGWDYSSRWLANGRDLHTIHTTDLIAVDLNSLLYGLEQAVSEGCRALHDLPCVRHYRTLALRRKVAIERYLWSDELGGYVDMNWKDGRRQRLITAATVVPLFMDVAGPDRAAAVARTIEARLLKDHGLVTTPLETGQQWDAPNGWAPLQWMAVDGLRRHGQERLAREIASRWIGAVQAVYRQSGKLTEKYNVLTLGKGGGGEYPGQDGFGWTNGVTARLLAMYPAASGAPARKRQATEPVLH